VAKKEVVGERHPQVLSRKVDRSRVVEAEVKSVLPLVVGLTTQRPRHHGSLEQSSLPRVDLGAVGAGYLI
jgi:hypothetical protein